MSAVTDLVKALKAEPGIQWADWYNSGGGCMVIGARLGTDTDHTELTIGDAGNGPFDHDAYDNDTALSGEGFGISRCDAEGEPDESYDFTAPTAAGVLAEVRRLVAAFVPADPKPVAARTTQITLEVTYDENRMSHPRWWNYHHLLNCEATYLK
jgi:hypothetical protein